MNFGRRKEQRRGRGGLPGEAESDDRLWASAQGFLVAFRARRDELLRRNGFTPAQFGLMSTLAVEGPVTTGEMAERIGVTAAAVSYVADGLHRAGLLARARPRADRRKVVLRITPKGQSALRAVDEARVAILDEFRDALDVREREVLSDLLGRLSDALGTSRHAVATRRRDEGHGT